MAVKSITPFLWFNTEAEDAAKFYVSLFENSRITQVSRYSEGTPMPKGTVMVVAFELDGHPFSALNGGPHFTFTPAISFQIECATQEEVDYYWEKLSEGGAAEAQQCGWLADKFGLSWQIVPKVLPELLAADDPVKSGRAFDALLRMKKLDIAALQRAFDGEA